MRFPSPLRSRDYGNPEDIVAARQAEAANRVKRAEMEIKPYPATKRPTITLKRGEWSEARKAAESLFARGAAVSGVQTPAASATEALSGEFPDRTCNLKRKP